MHGHGYTHTLRGRLCLLVCCIPTYYSSFFPFPTTTGRQQRGQGGGAAAGGAAGGVGGCAGVRAMWMAGWLFEVISPNQGRGKACVER